MRERERGTLEQLLVSPLSRGGLMLGKLVPYLCIGMVMAVILFPIMRFMFDVPIAGNVVGMMFSTLVYVFALLSLGLLVGTKADKPNASVADVDGVPLAERLFLRLHFSAGNHALDFLRARRALPDHIFYRPDARDHSPRRTFFRILAEPCHPYRDVDPAFRSLRFAVSKEDRVMRAVGRLGSARVSRAGCGVPPQQSFETVVCAQWVTRRKVRNGEDAIANTRDACATQKVHGHISGYGSAR